MGRRSLPPFQGSLACLWPSVPGLMPRAIDGRPFGALGTNSERVPGLPKKYRAWELRRLQ